MKEIWSRENFVAPVSATFIKVGLQTATGVVFLHTAIDIREINQGLLLAHGYDERV